MVVALGLMGAELFSYAHAQVDPSTSLLLRSGGKTPERRDLDSRRYTLRPGSERPTPTSETSTQEPEPSALSAQPPPPQEPLLDQKEEALIDSELRVEEGIEEELTRLRRLRDLFLGGSAEGMEDYIKSIHPQDPRLNIMELSVAPAFLYYDSSSAFWYRDYYSAGPGLSTELGFWVTPHFGVHFDYMTSLGHSLESSPVGGVNLGLRHQDGAMGLKLRQHFGLSRRAPSLLAGLNFRESQVKIAGPMDNRFSHRSSGLEVSLQLRVPNSNFHSWTFGLRLMPQLSHQEKRVTSGSKSKDNYQVNLSLGSVYVLDRNQQLFWSLRHRFERTNFSGPALRIDPKTSVTPQGVRVDQGLTVFEFGYTWGN